MIKTDGGDILVITISSFSEAKLSVHTIDYRERDHQAPDYSR